MARDARVRLRPRIAAAVAAAAAAVLIASQGERAVLGWAARLAREGAPHERRGAIEKLRQLGDAGVPVLLVVALDPTPVPLEFDPGDYAMFVPRDAASDLALDALRRLRMGGASPRALEWGPDYAAALNEWRTAEFVAAVEWWEAKRKAAPPPTGASAEKPSPKGSDRDPAVESD
jgi:hypothetical protein